MAIRLRDINAVFLKPVGIGTSNPQGLLHLSKLTDPALVLTNETGNQHYLVGIDDSAENKPLVIANGQVVGTNTRISLDPIDGRTTFLGGVRIGNDSLSPSAGVIYHDGTGSSTTPTKAGRVEYGWHKVGTNVSGSTYYRYKHIKTNLDTRYGGTPTGPQMFIMGGLHMTGYRYSIPSGDGAGSGHIADSWVMFHNWASLFPGLEVLNNGTWNAAISPYAASDGMAVFVIDYGKAGYAGYYAGLNVDFHQSFDGYSWRDVKVTAETCSNSATGAY